MPQRLISDTKNDRIVRFLAQGFGTGWSPLMPGTCGTLVGVGVYLLLPPLPLSGYFLITLSLLGIGIGICGRTARLIGNNDHPSIVFDEIVGFLITMIGAPDGWLWVVMGFVFFRLFDITKPWPIRWVERHFQGGLGIMLDDVVAGIFSLLCLQLIVIGKIIA